MSGTLHLDFEVFKKNANAYADVIPPIDKSVDGLRACVENAKGQWDGAAKDAFKKFADLLFQEIKDVNISLGQVSDTLRTGEQKVASAEQESMDGFTTLNSNYL